MTILDIFIIQLMNQSVNEKQQYINKLNRIAPELCKISPGAGARSLEAKVDSDNTRYENVKQDVNSRGEKLFDLLSRTSTVSHPHLSFLVFIFTFICSLSPYMYNSKHVITTFCKKYSRTGCVRGGNVLQEKQTKTLL